MNKNIAEHEHNEACCNEEIKVNVLDLNGQKTSELVLSDDIFAIMPRLDVISQMVRYQLAKRRAGTACTMTRSEVRGTTKKYKAQKEQGTRHGDKRAPIFRKGGISFGPKPRSYEFKLNKKLKRLALTSMLSLKLLQQKLNIFDKFDLPDYKTKTMVEKLAHLNYKKVLFVHDADCPALVKAIGNIPYCQFMKTCGLNVYDILRYDHLAMTKEAVESITKRLKLNI